MPALDRNEKVPCDKCGTPTVKQNLARHKKSCTSGTLHCKICPNYFTKSQNDLDYHLAKKHAPKGQKINTTCGICNKHFHSYYAMQQHKKTEHKTLSKVATDSSKNFAKDFELEETEQLRDEL